MRLLRDPRSGDTVELGDSVLDQKRARILLDAGFEELVQEPPALAAEIVPAAEQARRPARKRKR